MVSIMLGNALRGNHCEISRIGKISENGKRFKGCLRLTTAVRWQPKLQLF